MSHCFVISVPTPFVASEFILLFRGSELYKIVHVLDKSSFWNSVVDSWDIPCLKGMQQVFNCSQACKWKVLSSIRPQAHADIQLSDM